MDDCQGEDRKVFNSGTIITTDANVLDAMYLQPDASNMKKRQSSGLA
jgi:hypothetical protein